MKKQESGRRFSPKIFQDSLITFPNVLLQFNQCQDFHAFNVAPIKWCFAANPVPKRSFLIPKCSLNICKYNKQFLSKSKSYLVAMKK